MLYKVGQVDLYAEGALEKVLLNSRLKLLKLVSGM